ncbi:uncharacterized protein V1510DRAFT_401547 [Dipodascopsis tothii]|uniref:uncharacterized protein n=1 Tax=Dipodascopsis tothii TaxID=44089 RepID=UPI0034CF8E78
MTTRITLATFAEAIRDLPTDTLYAEEDRLENSIRHLRRSNDEMAAFADDDAELAAAIDENTAVIADQGARIDALHAELRRRHGEHVIASRAAPASAQPAPPADDAADGVHL